MVNNRLRTLRERAGLTLQALAASTGTTAPQINKLERGERRMTIDWMTRLAPALGVDPKDLLPEIGGAESGPAEAGGGDAVPRASRQLDPAPALPLDDLIPVRGAARGGIEQEMFLQDGPIDFVPRPPWLAHVRDAYTIYVVGDSMMPRYRPGQLLYVNPHKPPQSGSGVIVTKRGNAVLMKEFRRQHGETLFLHQYNPDTDLEYPLKDILSVHTVIGLIEP